MKITINNTNLDYLPGTSLLEISKNFENLFQSKIVGAWVDGHEKSLNYRLTNNCSIRFIELQSTIGMRIYARSLLFVLQIALNNLGITNTLNVRGHLKNSFYCTLSLNNETSVSELIPQIKEEMQIIINENHIIEYHNIEKKAAYELFKSSNSNNIHFLELIQPLKQEYISYYKCMNNINYFFSPLVPYTKYLKVFDVVPYRQGVLIRFPSLENVSTLPEYIDSPGLATIYAEAEEWAEYLNCDNLADLNNKILNNEFLEIMQIAEALQEKKIAQIADIIATKKPIKKLILIAGPSSSGKTTFANRLRIQLIVNGIKPETISVDDYFVPRELTPRLDSGEFDFENINTIDLKLFNNHLKKLLNGEKVEIPSFEFETGSRKYTGKTLQLSPNQPLIIEGIHCLNDKLTSDIDLDKKFKIYVSAITGISFNEYNRIPTTYSRILRRMVRDYRYRGHTPSDTLKMWPRVRDGEEKNIFPYQESADIMFNTSLIYELPILKKYAEPLLYKIKTSEPEYTEACRLLNLLQHINIVDNANVPTNSLLREFIGN